MSTWVGEVYGWTCRNGHYQERARSQDVCERCGAVRDPHDTYQDIERSGPKALKGFGMAGASEAPSHGLKRSTSQAKFFKCLICTELFRPVELQVHNLDSDSKGFEQPGTAIGFFLSREELKAHIKDIHKGKRFADRHHGKLGKGKRP